MTDTQRISAAVRRVLDVAHAVAKQQAMTAYAVGGCVRDWLLGRAVTDVDVVVEGDGLVLARLLAREFRAALAIHEQFGTASLALPDGDVARLDVATCRAETYREPAAYPEVRAGTLAEDLARRDFTVNAMAMRLDQGEAFGTLVDPHDGQGDLQRQWIRVLHEHSFRDDPSRILRAVRFEQRLGYGIEPQTLTWLARAVAQGWHRKLNAGRWRKELQAFAREPNPAACRSRLRDVLGEDPPEV